jgi:type I restriction enzyme S subunit
MTTQTRNKWSISTLDELVSLVIDYRGKTPKKLGGDWSDHGIPALSAKNIKEGRIIREDQIRYVDDGLYRKWMKEELNESDLLLTSEAPIGEVYIIKKTDPKYCLSQRVFAVRTKQEILNPKYLFYYFQAPDGKHELLKRATGTTVGGIRQTALLNTEIKYPVLELQNNIANTLSAYDDLIENITRRIKILEQIYYY